jgi:hypothetical protein
MGVGSALVLEAVTTFLLEEEEACVEATAPVRTRATTAARTMCFMMEYPESCIYVLKISLDKRDVVTIR